LGRRVEMRTQVAITKAVKGKLSTVNDSQHLSVARLFVVNLSLTVRRKSAPDFPKTSSAADRHSATS
jgi:hypothetical protein